MPTCSPPPPRPAEALLDLGPLEFSHLRLASLDGRSMRQLSCSRLLCALLLGLELLELLDRQEEAQQAEQAEQAAAGQPRAAEADEAPGAAGAAEAPGAAGQTGGAPSDALVGRLARLTVAGWASKDSIDPMALADALAEVGLGMAWLDAGPGSKRTSGLVKRAREGGYCTGHGWGGRAKGWLL